jgi:PAS domain-containing protein
MIKKLRRKGIASYGAANQFLEKEYLPQHNRRFARVPTKPEDYHGRKPTARELGQIFRLETERRISNDWVIRHGGRYLQLQPAGQRRYGPTQSKALVCEWEDGAMEVYYRGQRLAYRELAEPLPRKCEVDDRTKHSVAVPLLAKPRKPSQDHPWRRDYRGMKPNWSRKVEIPPRTVAGTEAWL